MDIPINTINTFMALGDSITAGFSILGKIEENRGSSFPIGGDSNAITLPNLFKKYTNSSNISGSSFGNHFFELVNWNRYPQDNLNAAQSGATIQDIMDQIYYLINNTNDTGSNWKHINLFIGANNLCRCCKGNPEDSPQNFGKILTHIIDTIFTSFKNIILSVLSIPNFTNLKNLESNSLNCKFLHTFITECQCIFKGTPNDINFVSKYTVEYNKIIREIYFNKKKEYPTLLLHPFNEQTIVPSENYVSSFDCFHPSLIAHENFAIATWNSLFLPFEKKVLKWDFNTTIYVPSSVDQYINLN